MKYEKFVEWAFYGLLGFFAWRMVNSVEDLNTRMAQVLERTDWLSRTTLNHDTRILRLETERK